jgi:hypothetical protein
MASRSTCSTANSGRAFRLGILSVQGRPAPGRDRLGAGRIGV